MATTYTTNYKLTKIGDDTLVSEYPTLQAANMDQMDATLNDIAGQSKDASEDAALALETAQDAVTRAGRAASDAASAISQASSAAESANAAADKANKAAESVVSGSMTEMTASDIDAICV